MNKIEKVKLEILYELSKEILKNVDEKETYSNEESELLEQIKHFTNLCNNVFEKETKEEDFSITLEEVEKLVEQSKTLETIIYLDYNTLLYMEDIDVLNDYVVDVVTNKTYSFELLDISYEVLGVINKNVVFKVVATPYISD